MVVIAVVLVALSGMYGLAQWYIHTQDKPQKFGASFIPAYASSLGVDPEETMDGIIGIGVRQFRLVSYWDQMEPQQGQYDFSLLDWQFEKAEKAGAKVSLSVGLRQPRWPECHMPTWALDKPQSQWQPQLENYVTQVVNRYKNSPALDSYQIENEYFLVGFGNCESIPGAMDRQRFIKETALVRKLDPKHTIIINRSNNGIGWPAGRPTPDLYGVSVYKRVWDAQTTHRYYEYPMPAWYYAFLAGWQKLFLGRDMIAHELQAEAWPPDHKAIQDIDLAEQSKSINAKRLDDRFDYGKDTGMSEIYLWGAEYWYYRKQIIHDDSLWRVAQNRYTAQLHEANK